MNSEYQNNEKLNRNKKNRKDGRTRKRITETLEENY